MPNWSISLTVTWNYTFIVPTDYTLVTSLPSFLEINSLGFIYSARFPFSHPNISDNNELDIGQKRWTYLEWVPGVVGTWVTPWPQTISLPRKSLAVKVKMIWGHPVTL